MTREIDVKEEINDEWVKLLNHIEKNFPDDYKTLRQLIEISGETPKQLFEQGYRSGWNGATAIIKESVQPAQQGH